IALTMLRLENKRSRRIGSVTGGSGYTASWLVKISLKRGYTLKASFRDKFSCKQWKSASCKASYGKPLMVLELEIFQEEIVGKPSVKVTLSVLRSCSKFIL
ncbi:hypothetical protein TorRG33x02_193970, partial [Trema orientale]